MPLRRLNSWMWAEACDMVDQAERLHRQYFRLGTTPNTTRAWEPPLDVVSTANELRITVALPGVEPNDISIRAHGGLLFIAAERHAPDLRSVAIHRLEIPYGRFERRIALPPGRYVVAEQRYNQGCLEIRLSKS